VLSFLFFLPTCFFLSFFFKSFQPHYDPGVYSGIFLGSKLWLALKADNLTTIYEPITQKVWEL
jgi:hypothetical protein